MASVNWAGHKWRHEARSTAEAVRELLSNKYLGFSAASTCWYITGCRLLLLAATARGCRGGDPQCCQQPLTDHPRNGTPSWRGRITWHLVTLVNDKKQFEGSRKVSPVCCRAAGLSRRGVGQGARAAVAVGGTGAATSPEFSHVSRVSSAAGCWLTPPPGASLTAAAAVAETCS